MTPTLHPNPSVEEANSRHALVAKLLQLQLPLFYWLRAFFLIYCLLCSRAFPCRQIIQDSKVDSLISFLPSLFAFTQIQGFFAVLSVLEYKHGQLSTTLKKAEILSSTG
jgi:hypothetical protein